MSISRAKLIDKLRQTLRWRPEVEKTATSFAGLSVDEYEQLVRQLIESGDDKALGILLCVCGVAVDLGSGHSNTLKNQ